MASWAATVFYLPLLPDLFCLSIEWNQLPSFVE
jgi:hypothetical protein